jgi:hypothetical protein
MRGGRKREAGLLAVTREALTVSSPSGSSVVELSAEQADLVEAFLADAVGARVVQASLGLDGRRALRLTWDSEGAAEVVVVEPDVERVAALSGGERVAARARLRGHGTVRP